MRFSDNGCGISQELLPRLGEPFYTTKEMGTGLGLLVSNKIIKDHHGSINITSEINKGTSPYLFIFESLLVSFSLAR
ncbi:ATP-binding protein [Brevibacillus choshinensis]|uniref:ATP-binding protein n=1 Tax=Brevibacillus choshinensis TaxID=54911 RepID=UPI003D19ECE6